MTRSRGFTLVELLVVLTIIVALVAVLMPATVGARDAAMVAVCASNQRNVGLSAVSYAMDSAQLLPCYRDTASWMSEPWHSRYFYFQKYVNLGRVWKAGLVSNGHIFYCPANTQPIFSYEGYVDPVTGAWPTPNKNFNSDGKYVRTGYQFNPWVRSASDPVRLFPKLQDLRPNRIFNIDMTSDMTPATLSHARMGGVEPADGRPERAFRPLADRRSQCHRGHQ